ncbi:SDR family NAD(P)-dependent oxidoreductase [Streptomyces qinglanensis]|uniref:SDR family NAD(P)-dependent oxidoreductase n=1 Tax=Streptomyces qinglanensis TaxID=943816 RepID=UPI0037BD1893
MEKERRIALVTGSSSGIGAAVARRLTESGMRVVVNSSSSTGAGEKLAEELPGARYIRADVADENEARRLVARTEQECGGLDVLVNCAGVTAHIPLDDLAAADSAVWRRILDVNVLGVWNVVTAAEKSLRRARGGGCVVNVSSVAGLRPGGSSVPYAVSKAAVNHLTRILAKALAPDIRVNAVAPGMTDTPWFDVFDDKQERFEKASGAIPLGRVGTPEDVAGVCLHFTDAPYITGQVLAVDGGTELL